MDLMNTKGVTTMHLWDVIVKQSLTPPFAVLTISRVPNGDPLPKDTGNGVWFRADTAVSEDEAKAQIELFNGRFDATT
jgi:hypothetical protein